MTGISQYVTLGVADELFAAPVDRVREILELRPIARLPHAPEGFLGMIDVRGQGVPVIDLRARLGLPPGVDDEHSRIIVLQTRSGALEEEGENNGANALGLKTDRVFEVTVLDEAELDPPPAGALDWRGSAIAGIGRRNGAFVTVLDLDQLLAPASHEDAA